MKRMLMNASNDEWRIALVEGNSLQDLDIEMRGQEQITANIYKGRVTRVEPSLEAAFIDYGGNRHGFLPIKEVASEYFPAGADTANMNIKDALKENQEIIVQVEKEERGTKGAALTTFITLAGCYLVLMPNNPNAGGISRRIEGEERDELRDLLDNLVIPEGMGVIIRTAGVGKSLEELQWDLDALIKVWEAIKESSHSSGKAPFLIHQEGDAIIRAVRDYLRADVEDIVVDDQEVYERLSKYLERVRPEFAGKVKLHDNKTPLFSHFKIEQQVETAFQREVRLHSGGAIVIDPTEALIAIDINSSRATKGGDIEETALNTNLEAADEIARQLRLRDMGGLIIIDFIDMLPIRNKRAVEKRLRDALHKDRARVQIGSISRFGLLEMSRQRLRSSLRESRQSTCPRCHGQGSIRGVVSLTSSLLRLIEEKAHQESTAQVRVQVPHDVATYIFNEKRQMLSDIERANNISVMVIANPHLEAPNYEIEAVTVHEYATSAGEKLSYEMVHQPEVEVTYEPTKQEPAPKAKTDKPTVKTLLPDLPAPTKKAKTAEGSSFLQRLVKNLFGSDEKEKVAEKTSTSRDHHEEGERGDNRNRRYGDRGGQRRQPRDGNNNYRRNNRESGPRTPREHTPRDNNAPRDNAAARDIAPRDHTPRDHAPRETMPRDNLSAERDGNTQEGTRDNNNRSRNNRRPNTRGEGANRSRNNNRRPGGHRPRDNNGEQQDIHVSVDITPSNEVINAHFQAPVHAEVKHVIEKPVLTPPVMQKPTPTVSAPVQEKAAAVEAPKKPARKPLPPPPSSSLVSGGDKMVQVETQSKD